VLVLFAVAGFFDDGVSSNSNSPPIRAGVRTPGPDPNAFELVAQQFDPKSPPYEANCLLLNPQWRWQVDYPIKNGKPTLDNFPDSLEVSQCDKNFDNCVGGQCEPKRADCKPNQDLPPVLCPMCYLGQNNPERIHGHYNWFPATYTGTVCFNDYSYPDLDYTFSLVPEPDSHAFPGLSRWNPPAEHDPKKSKKCGPNRDQECGVPKAFHIEFDSIETIEEFQSKLWSGFRDQASPCKTGPLQIKSCDQDKARDLVKNRRAVVIGLVGLDSEHNIYSELHPIYAIAIEMDDDPIDHSNRWMIFARNNGDEGACAYNPHPLFGPVNHDQPLEQLMLLIPPPRDEDVSGASLGDRTVFYSNNSSSPTAAYFDKLFPDPAGANFENHNKGLLLTFDLNKCSEPGCTPLVEGEVHINWQVVGTRAALAATPDECVNPAALEKEEKDKFRKPTKSQVNQFRQLILEARINGRATMEASNVRFGLTNSAPISACTKVVDKITPEDLSRIIGVKTSTEKRYMRIKEILNRP